MSPTNRSNRAIYEAIRALAGHFDNFTIREIARVSTYSIPTVLRAISALETSGYISVDRSARNGHPKQPHHYAILREMEHE
jgi:DNA-binding MurR/RpiR family transcriptional regulator